MYIKANGEVAEETMKGGLANYKTEKPRATEEGNVRKDGADEGREGNPHGAYGTAYDVEYL